MVNDLLIPALTQEVLQEKQEPTLRTILFRSYGISKGVSKLDKQQLIDLILLKEEEAQRKRDAEYGIDTTVIHCDENNKEFKALFVPESDENDECIQLTDKDGEVSYIEVDELKTKYVPMKYTKFSREQPKPQYKTLKNVKGATNAWQRLYKQTIERYGFTDETDEGFIKEKAEIVAQTNKQFSITYGYDDLEKAKAALQFYDEADSKPKQVDQSKETKTSRITTIIQELIDSGEKYTSGTVMKKMKELHGESVNRSWCITLINKVKAAQKNE